VGSIFCSRAVTECHFVSSFDIRDRNIEIRETLEVIEVIEGALACVYTLKVQGQVGLHPDVESACLAFLYYFRFLSLGHCTYVGTGIISSFLSRISIFSSRISKIN